MSSRAAAMGAAAAAARRGRVSDHSATATPSIALEETGKRELEGSVIVRRIFKSIFRAHQEDLVAHILFINRTNYQQHSGALCLSVALLVMASGWFVSAFRFEISKRRI